MAGITPTKNSLKYLRELEQFHHIEVVEKWQQIPGRPGGGIRQDFAGIIDILCLGPDGTLAVQTTSAGAFSAHMKKLREHPSTRILLKTPGWRIEVHGWAKKKNRWTLTHKKEFILDPPTEES